jgi:pyruvate dehydrogenase E1 component alpha subunit
VQALGLADAADLDAIDEAAAAEMDAALETAAAAAAPDAPEMFEDVYAPGTAAPLPQAARLRAILSETAP